ncbi:hypothetical protein PG2T_04830 [Immundisolibacter cernigliae]|uniref:Uncharacterized protein n=1 Tax=Immundisolibacter cernigliae TaxID=1810504 RepID=A0A1B1YS79_9GAMM|nr:hypothetical protein PG2T_04830 [Immundisolibacter cernigliae]
MIEKIGIFCRQDCLHQTLGQGTAVERNTSLVAELGNVLPVQGINPQRLRESGLGQLIDRRQVPFEQEVSADGDQRKQ